MNSSLSDARSVIYRKLQRVSYCMYVSLERHRRSMRAAAGRGRMYQIQGEMRSATAMEASCVQYRRCLDAQTEGRYEAARKKVKRTGKRIKGIFYPAAG